ncbi:MAG TPA: phosphatase PAP2 family protein [Pseudolabrys sp.]|jgi:hypothetical protein
MLQPDAQAAWRLLSFNWILLGLMALALGLAMALTGFSIAPSSALLPFAIVATYTGVGYYNAFRPHKRDPLVIFILASTGQVLLIPLLMTPMTYIATSAGLPLQDANLAAIDRALGLDWQAYFDFVCSHHTLLSGLVLAYAMIGWPVFGIPVALGFARQYRRIQEFTLAFGLALIITTALAMLLPAIGTYDIATLTRSDAPFTSSAFLQHLHDFPSLRAGTLHHLDLMKLTGVISFPSFHAAAATLYLWAFWPVRWMRPIAVLANVSMLLATPIGGGHYFIDVFAGMAVAVAAVVAARATTTWLLRPAERPATHPTSVPDAAPGSAR